MEWFDWGVALLTLTALEIVLGIDNIVLISIAVEKLSKEQQTKAARIGLGAALILRVVFLSLVTWLAKLTGPIFFILDHGFSVRDLVLLLGGLFLLAKATTEVYRFTELHENHDHEFDVAAKAKTKTSFAGVIATIVIFDVIFSLDSVLTAVGLAKQLSVMIIAVVAAMILMLIFARAVTEFVQSNPAIKLLALSFLVLIGVLLIAEGWGSHLDRGYVYFAMAFSLGVELLNRRRKNKMLATRRNVASQTGG